jgi:hypothetical protein
VVTELLRHPSGASRPTVRIEGRGDGLPDRAGAQFITALQRRREQGVSLEGGDIVGEHRLHSSILLSAWPRS